MFEYAFGPPLAILLGLTMKGQINSFASVRPQSQKGQSSQLH